MNNVIQMLMNQLKMRSPQALQQYQNLRQGQNNPQQFLNEITKNYTPDQMERFRKYATSFGFTDEQLNQYGIKIK